MHPRSFKCNASRRCVVCNAMQLCLRNTTQPPNSHYICGLAGCHDRIYHDITSHQTTWEFIAISGSIRGDHTMPHIKPTDMGWCILLQYVSCGIHCRIGALTSAWRSELANLHGDPHMAMLQR
jgi:hypothetical protein